jgi:hypothetical protein
MGDRQYLIETKGGIFLVENKDKGLFQSIRSPLKEKQWVIYVEGKEHYILGLQSEGSYIKEVLISKDNIPAAHILEIDQFIKKMVRFSTVFVSAIGIEILIRYLEMENKKKMDYEEKMAYANKILQDHNKMSMIEKKFGELLRFVWSPVGEENGFFPKRSHATFTILNAKEITDELGGIGDGKKREDLLKILKENSGVPNNQDEMNVSRLLRKEVA